MTGRLGALVRTACRHRQFSTSMVRFSGAGRPGQPGENLPLNLDWGKYKITLALSVFFGIASSAPWLVIMWSFIK